MRAVTRHPAASFLLTALLFLGVCAAAVRSRAFAANPDVAAWGITFDLTISLPALYWFFFVRTGRARPLTLAPIFLAGALAASLLIPAAQQRFLIQLRTVAIPLTTAALVIAIGRRLLAERRAPSAGSDPHERIAAAARVLAGEGRVADVIASEMAMFYYALFVWRRRPEEREDAVTFHERSGWSTIVAAIFVIIAAEGLGMHLLLSRWSSTAAWCWTALDVWAVIWFLGDYHALRLRRTWLDAAALHLHFGLRWSVTVPREQIATVSEIHGETEWKRAGVLKVAILDEPRWLVTLREPVEVRGMAGIRRTVTALALLPDQEEWLARLSASLPELPPR